MNESEGWPTVYPFEPVLPNAMSFVKPDPDE